MNGYNFLGILSISKRDYPDKGITIMRIFNDAELPNGSTTDATSLGRDFIRRTMLIWNNDRQLITIKAMNRSRGNIILTKSEYAGSLLAI